MYDQLLEATARAGFHQYEVANFARRGEPDCEGIPDLACRHNINYWRGGEYYGLGPSAAGFVGGIRAKNWSNTQFYCELLERGQRAVESQEDLPPLQRAGELAAFGLRMNAGWPFADFQARTGYDLSTEWKAEIAQLIAQGLARADRERLHLTPTGMRFADLAAEQFLR
jgi:oxygen-independent coproporphyrinogen-3 oxidase